MVTSRNVIILLKVSLLNIRLSSSIGRALVKAYKLGLIDRERVKSEGKGNWRMYNKLAKRDKQVVKLAEGASLVYGVISFLFL